MSTGAPDTLFGLTPVPVPGGLLATGSRPGVAATDANGHTARTASKAPSARAQSASPPQAVGVVRVPAHLPGQLRAATRLSVPIALAVVVGIFLVAQAQLGKRDPKLADAPHDRDEDGLTFS